MMLQGYTITTKDGEYVQTTFGKKHTLDTIDRLSTPDSVCYWHTDGFTIDQYVFTPHFIG